jgi:RNAse (barnase) inhibitor barstar
MNILHPFFAELTEKERLYSVFQQDSATAHTAHVSLEALWEVFDDRVISRGLWVPTFPI